MICLNLLIQILVIDMKNKRLKFNGGGELVYHKDFDSLNTQATFKVNKKGNVNYNINTGTDTLRFNINKTNKNKNFNVTKELKNNNFLDFEKSGPEYKITFGKKF